MRGTIRQWNPDQRKSDKALDEVVGGSSDSSTRSPAYERALEGLEEASS